MLYIIEKIWKQLFFWLQILQPKISSVLIIFMVLLEFLWMNMW
jgi:hypothetical protein